MESALFQELKLKDHFFLNKCVEVQCEEVQVIKVAFKIFNLCFCQYQ